MIRLALPLLRSVEGLAGRRLSPVLLRQMMSESRFLMLNHLLATIFFKSDVILMEAINGVTIVGVYSTAYKWLDALNIIPAFFTLARCP
ncbi:MAG: oligosaccharide flippase family protein [Anaerolineae bacterium]|nr:oligosaccharide flippase family protein [Anaerolineae bacterium]